VAEETFDLNELEPVFEEFAGQKGVLIPVLQRAQGIYGYLPAEVLKRISERMGVSLSQVYGVATFYAKIVHAIEQDLGIKAGETTPDYRVTYEVVYCLGSCGLAPVASVNDEVVGKLVPERMLEIVRAMK
jgi:NADH-quinone oxidoreductase subunit E